MPILISGTIAFPPGTEHFIGATLYVMVEDVGMMGAPAQIIAQHTQRNVSYDGSPIPFSLEGNMPPASNHYNLRVLVSFSGSNEIERGDFITKQRYSVLQNGTPDTVRVQVERV
ncbi:MAG: YbaY family lipoprotein [Anaerolineae bacterium]|nr:YbaY family lipoprotein [Anaerolineae bacterium]